MSELKNTASGIATNLQPACHSQATNPPRPCRGGVTMNAQNLIAQVGPDLRARAHHGNSKIASAFARESCAGFPAALRLTNDSYLDMDAFNPSSDRVIFS